ncbi:MAG: lysophospholipid acyltransferase family protein, partial [Longicatena sp.]
MYLLRCLKLIWIVPGAWIGSILIRKKPMDERYAYLARWAKRLMDAFKIQIQIHQEEELPSEGPILFVGNHQSEFDMLIQMCAIKRPFTFISKVENEKTPFVGSWSKTLDVLFFDRN